VAKEAAAYLGRPLETLNLISLHLGNGASAAAIEGGKSVDTSMGMTPLEGLIMGTRCGDLDPAIPFYLERETGMKPEQLETILNQKSGMKGICGVNDMREVIRLAEAGDKDAELALAMYCYRIRKYIGAYSAVLGRVDALIFTGGVGENSPVVRERCGGNLANLGIVLDNQKNQGGQNDFREIQASEAPSKVLVIPTNEELEVARQTLACIQKQATL
jgi:acetate kinase